jgi:hypothetical protein
MISNILENLMVKGELTQFCCGYKYGSVYGYILYHDSEYVTIKEYNQNGFYEGLEIFRTEAIENIAWNGNNMIARTKIIHRVGINTDPVDVDITSFDGFINTVNAKYGYVVVSNDRGDTCYRGPVVAHDSEFIHMIRLGGATRMDRSSYLIRMTNVTSLSVDSICDRNILMLHNGTE